MTATLPNQLRYLSIISDEQCKESFQFRVWWLRNRSASNYLCARSLVDGNCVSLWNDTILSDKTLCKIDSSMPVQFIASCHSGSACRLAPRRSSAPRCSNGPSPNAGLMTSGAALRNRFGSPLVRSCPGRRLALMEVSKMAALILRDFGFEIVGHGGSALDLGMATHDEGWLHLIMTR